MQQFAFDSVNSTNDVAAQLIASGEIVDDAFVVAREQTNGRGTNQRVWHSPRDAGLYASIVLIDVGPAGAPMRDITLACGVACAKSLGDCYSVDVRVKPINDLILNDGKLGGILTEASIEAGRIRSLIIGVGINFQRVALELPSDAIHPAFLFDHCDGGATPAEFAPVLAASIQRTVRVLLQDGVSNDCSRGAAGGPAIHGWGRDDTNAR